MRVRLSMIAVLVGLALGAIPVASAIAGANDHAAHGQIDPKADKAVARAASLCCPAPGFAAVDHAVDMFTVVPDLWGRPGSSDHIGLLRAREPPPPRL
ncbi:MAG: hypothetical protein L6R19_17915 [Alphaproteobacteria bacterium]|nr:hypothetical protein [Alphaproteobacteria bacterium]